LYVTQRLIIKFDIADNKRNRAVHEAMSRIDVISTTMPKNKTLYINLE